MPQSTAKPGAKGLRTCWYCPVCGEKHGLTAGQFFQSEEDFCRCKSCGAPLYLKEQATLLFTVAAAAAELLLLRLLYQVSTDGFLAMTKVLWAITFYALTDVYGAQLTIHFIHFLEGIVLLYLLHPVGTAPLPLYERGRFHRSKAMRRYELCIFVLFLLVWLKERRLLLEGIRMLRALSQ